MNYKAGDRVVVVADFEALGRHGLKIGQPILLSRRTPQWDHQATTPTWEVDYNKRVLQESEFRRATPLKVTREDFL